MSFRVIVCVFVYRGGLLGPCLPAHVLALIETKMMEGIGTRFNRENVLARWEAFWLMTWDGWESMPLVLVTREGCWYPYLPAHVLASIKETKMLDGFEAPLNLCLRSQGSRWEAHLPSFG